MIDHYDEDNRILGLHALAAVLSEADAYDLRVTGLAQVDLSFFFFFFGPAVKVIVMELGQVLLDTLMRLLHIHEARLMQAALPCLGLLLPIVRLRVWVVLCWVDRRAILADRIRPCDQRWRYSPQGINHGGFLHSRQTYANAPTGPTAVDTEHGVLLRHEPVAGLFDAFAIVCDAIRSGNCPPLQGATADPV
jgi:hypothetical protein